jgi:hypothetical protein
MSNLTKILAYALATLLMPMSLTVDAAARERAVALGCSGVPSDPAIPEAGDRADSATHGPGAPGVPVRLQAVSKPFGFKAMPPLYIYGPVAEHVTGFHAGRRLLEDPIFDEAEQSAYWGELVGDQYFLVPNLAPCDLEQVLGQPIGMRAPEDGLLFVQFVSSRCRDCDRLSEAIGRVIEQHPQTSFRWVQVSTSLPVK